MKKRLHRLLAVALGAAFVTSCVSAQPPTNGVTKARLGSLRRDDLVVVDVQSQLNTNAVQEIVREYDRTVVKPREDEIASGGYVPADPPVTSVNSQTGAVVIGVADIDGLESRLSTVEALARELSEEPDAIFQPVRFEDGRTMRLLDYLLLYATNNYTAAYNANKRAWDLEKWKYDVTHGATLGPIYASTVSSGVKCLLPAEGDLVTTMSPEGFTAERYDSGGWGRVRYGNEGIRIGGAILLQFPAKSGTVALTSDIVDASGVTSGLFLRLSGGTMTGTLHAPSVETGSRSSEEDYATLDDDGLLCEHYYRSAWRGTRYEYGCVKQDGNILSFPNGKGGTFALTSDITTPTALAGRVYDFSNQDDVKRALADVVRALGGTVKNAPTE